MGFRTKAYKRKYSAHRNSFCDVMTEEDLLKVKEALTVKFSRDNLSV